MLWRLIFCMCLFSILKMEHSQFFLAIFPFHIFHLVASGQILDKIWMESSFILATTKNPQWISKHRNQIPSAVIEERDWSFHTKTSSCVLNERLEWSHSMPIFSNDWASQLVLGLSGISFVCTERRENLEVERPNYDIPSAQIYCPVIELH